MLGAAQAFSTGQHCTAYTMAVEIMRSDGPLEGVTSAISWRGCQMPLHWASRSPKESWKWWACYTPMCFMGCT